MITEKFVDLCVDKEIVQNGKEKRFSSVGWSRKTILILHAKFYIAQVERIIEGASTLAYLKTFIIYEFIGTLGLKQIQVFRTLIHRSSTLLIYLLGVIVPKKL